MTDSKQALSILHEQIVNMLIEDNPMGGSVRCALIEDWTISHDGIFLSITGPAQDPKAPKHPPWLSFSHEQAEETFTVKSEIEPHLYDFIGLLLEVRRIRLEEPSESSEFHLRTALERLAVRWRSPGDPIDDRNQRGLIGELNCLLEATSIRGIEAIEAWDATGDELYDIEASNWIIESKATSKDPETVSISYPDQVDFRVQKTLILGVTRLNRTTKSGKTFPEIVSECLKTLPKMLASKLETSLAGRGYSRAMENMFSLRWEVHDTRYLLITEESNVLPCEILEGLPNTIRNIKYNLKTIDFPSSDLSELIGA